VGFSGPPFVLTQSLRRAFDSVFPPASTSEVDDDGKTVSRPCQCHHSVISAWSTNGGQRSGLSFINHLANLPRSPISVPLFLRKSRGIFLQDHLSALMGLNALCSCISSAIQPRLRSTVQTLRIAVLKSMIYRRKLWCKRDCKALCPDELV